MAPAVAGVNALLIVNLVVDLDIELVVRPIRYGAEIEVVEFSGEVGFRIEIDHGLPDGIDFCLRNYVENSMTHHLPPLTGWRVRSCGTRSKISNFEGIVNVIRRRREVPHSLGQRRHGRERTGRGDTADFFKIAEEKSLVFLDWPADGKTALVALDVWLGVGLGIEEIAGVHLRTLQEIPAAAVERVCPTLHDHVYDCAAVVAELRREAVVLDFHFLHALDQRLVVNVGVSSLALFGCADQCTIQPHLGGRVALPVGDEIRARRIIILRAGPCYLGHARRQEH